MNLGEGGTKIQFLTIWIWVGMNEEKGMNSLGKKKTHLILNFHCFNFSFHFKFFKNSLFLFHLAIFALAMNSTAPPWGLPEDRGVFHLPMLSQHPQDTQHALQPQRKKELNRKTLKLILRRRTLTKKGIMGKIYVYKTSCLEITPFWTLILCPLNALRLSSPSPWCLPITQ